MTSDHESGCGASLPGSAGKRRIREESRVCDGRHIPLRPLNLDLAFSFADYRLTVYQPGYRTTFVSTPWCWLSAVVSIINRGIIKRRFVYDSRSSTVSEQLKGNDISPVRRVPLHLFLSSTSELERLRNVTIVAQLAV